MQFREHVAKMTNAANNLKFENFDEQGMSQLP